MLLDLHRHIIAFLSHMHVFWAIFRLMYVMKRLFSLFHRRPFLEEFLAVKLFGAQVLSMRRMAEGFMDIRSVYVEAAMQMDEIEAAELMLMQQRMALMADEAEADERLMHQQRCSSSAAADNEEEEDTSSVATRATPAATISSMSTSPSLAMGRAAGAVVNSMFIRPLLDGSLRSSLRMRRAGGGAASPSTTANETNNSASRPASVMTAMSRPQSTVVTAAGGAGGARLSSSLLRGALSLQGRSSNTANGTATATTAGAGGSSSPMSSSCSSNPSNGATLQRGAANMTPNPSLALQTTQGTCFDKAESISDTLTLFRTGDDRCGDTILVWLVMPWDPQHVTSFACRLASAVGCHCAIARVTHLQQGAVPMAAAANAVAEEVLTALGTIEHECIIVGGCEVAGTVALHAIHSAAFTARPPVAMLLFDPFVGWRTHLPGASSSASSSSDGGGDDAFYGYGANNEVLSTRVDPSLTVGLDETTVGALVTRFASDVDKGCKGRVRSWFPSWLGNPPPPPPAAATLSSGKKNGNANTNASPPRAPAPPKGSTIPAPAPAPITAITRPGFAPPAPAITTTLPPMPPPKPSPLGADEGDAAADHQQQSGTTPTPPLLSCPILMCSDSANVWASQLRDFQQCLAAQGVDIALEEYVSSVSPANAVYGMMGESLSSAADMNNHHNGMSAEAAALLKAQQRQAAEDEVKAVLLGFMEDCELWLEEMINVGRFACGSSVFSYGTRRSAYPNNNAASASNNNSYYHTLGSVRGGGGGTAPSVATVNDMFWTGLNTAGSGASNYGGGAGGGGASLLSGVNRWGKRFRSMAVGGAHGTNSRCDTPNSMANLTLSQHTLGTNTFTNNHHGGGGSSAAHNAATGSTMYYRPNPIHIHPPTSHVASHNGGGGGGSGGCIAPGVSSESLFESFMSQHHHTNQQQSTNINGGGVYNRFQQQNSGNPSGQGGGGGPMRGGGVIINSNRTRPHLYHNNNMNHHTGGGGMPFISSANTTPHHRYASSNSATNTNSVALPRNTSASRLMMTSYESTDSILPPSIPPPSATTAGSGGYGAGGCYGLHNTSSSNNATPILAPSPATASTPIKGGGSGYLGPSLNSMIPSPIAIGGRGGGGRSAAAAPLGLGGLGAGMGGSGAMLVGTPSGVATPPMAAAALRQQQQQQQHSSSNTSGLQYSNIQTIHSASSFGAGGGGGGATPLTPFTPSYAAHNTSSTPTAATMGQMQMSAAATPLQQQHGAVPYRNGAHYHHHPQQQQPTTPSQLSYQQQQQQQQHPALLASDLTPPPSKLARRRPSLALVAAERASKALGTAVASNVWAEGAADEQHAAARSSTSNAVTPRLDPAAIVNSPSSHPATVPATPASSGSKGSVGEGGDAFADGGAAAGFPLPPAASDGAGEGQGSLRGGGGDVSPSSSAVYSSRSPPPAHTPAAATLSSQTDGAAHSYDGGIIEPLHADGGGGLLLAHRTASTSSLNASGVGRSGLLISPRQGLALRPLRTPRVSTTKRPSGSLSSFSTPTPQQIPPPSASLSGVL